MAGTGRILPVADSGVMSLLVQAVSRTNRTDTTMYPRKATKPVKTAYFAHFLASSADRYAPT